MDKELVVLGSYRYNFAISNTQDSTLEASADLVLTAIPNVGLSNIRIKEFDFTCHLVDLTASNYNYLLNNHVRLDLFGGNGVLININEGSPNVGDGSIVNNSGTLSSSAPLVFKSGTWYREINRIVPSVGKIRFQWRPFKHPGVALPVSYQFTGYVSIVFEKLG